MILLAHELFVGIVCKAIITLEDFRVRLIEDIEDGAVFEDEILIVISGFFADHFEDVESVEQDLILFVARDVDQIHKSIVILKDWRSRVNDIIEDYLNDFIVLPIFCEFLGNRWVKSRGNESVYFDVAANAWLKIPAFSFREVCTAIEFEIFACLWVRELFFVDIFDGMEHFVEGFSNDEELFGVFGHAERVVEAAVEESVLCVESKNFAMIEGIGEVVFHEFFVLWGVVHLLALLNEPVFGSLHVDFITVQIGQTVDITTIWD